MKLQIVDSRRPDDLKILSSKLERGDVFEYNDDIWITARGFQKFDEEYTNAIRLKDGLLAILSGREKVLPVNAQLIIGGFVREE